jgi:hypothetical protein
VSSIHGVHLSCVRLSVFSIFAFLLTVSAWGQATPSVPLVRDAFVLRRGKPVRVVRLGDHLKIVVCKAEYDSWAQAQHADPALSLYLDGRLMKGALAAPPLLVDEGLNDPGLSKDRQLCTDPSPSALYALDYYLDPDLVSKPDLKESWLQLLREPWNNASIPVSSGSESGSWPSQVTISFQRLNLAWLAAWAVLFIVADILFVQYARNSDIIRDTGALPPGVPAGSRKAYSLARTQMALWTFLVAAALAFIFLVTWNENVITNRVLVLLGISFGTTLLASVADGAEPVPQVTKGFLNDLLNDGTDPSFHRYQMLLFTVIVAVIFVVKAATNLVMPEFEPTLLGLMGISNGTYLGFKLQGR